jgi:hypothetical protein
MDTMDCTRARNLLSEFQDGTLDTATAASMAAHLRCCGKCATGTEELLAVRDLLGSLPSEPAPPELLERILAALEAEEGYTRALPCAGGAKSTKPNLSRFRIPLEAAAAVLLFAFAYGYQRSLLPVPRTPSSPVAPASRANPPSNASPGTPLDIASGSSSGSLLPSRNRKDGKESPAATLKRREWTTADLPSVPTILASTDFERIVPVVPSPGPAEEIPFAAGAGGFGESRSAETAGIADSRPARVFAAPPSRLLRPLPYGREIVVEVGPKNREIAERRIVETAIRLGGIVERIEHGPAGSAPNTSGTVRVTLPESGASQFFEEMGRIGTIPPEGKPASSDLPPGPRPGTVTYTVRLRIR